MQRWVKLIEEIQQKLKTQGLDPGPIDGIFGTKIEAAIRQFQADQRPFINGEVCPQMLTALDIPQKEVD